MDGLGVLVLVLPVYSSTQLFILLLPLPNNLLLRQLHLEQQSNHSQAPIIGGGPKI